MATSGMLPPPPAEPEPWSEKDFAPITAFLRHQIGITLETHRTGLLQARLRSRLQLKGFTQFHPILREGAQGRSDRLGCATPDRPEHGEPYVVLPRAGALHVPGRAGVGLAQGIAGDDDADLVGGVLLRPGTVQHGDGAGRDIRQPGVPEGGDLCQRLVAGDAQGCRRRRLHDARRSRSLAGAAPTVLPLGARAARGFISSRPRNSGPRQVPPHRSPQPDLGGPQRFPHHFLSQRVDLFRRRRTHDAPATPGPTFAPGGWLAMGNGEILPEVPPSLRKHSPSLFQKEG